MSDKSPLAERLRALRGSRTQAQVSEAWGIPVASIRRYEAGDHVPDAERVALICEREKVSADWLLMGHATQTIGEPEPPSYDGARPREAIASDDPTRASAEYQRMRGLQAPVDAILRDAGLLDDGIDPAAREMLRYGLVGAALGGAPLNALALIARAVARLGRTR
jgi:transcriptional regulator with XRE-family HTH domain